MLPARTVAGFKTRRPKERPETLHSRVKIDGAIAQVKPTHPTNIRGMIYPYSNVPEVSKGIHM